MLHTCAWCLGEEKAAGLSYLDGDGLVDAGGADALAAAAAGLASFSGADCAPPPFSFRLFPPFPLQRVRLSWLTASTNVAFLDTS